MPRRRVRRRAEVVAAKDARPRRSPPGSSRPTINVRSATARDATAWLGLRHALWPEGSAAEHREEIDRFFRGHAADPLAVLLAEDATGQAVGLAELSIRSHAEGCHSAAWLISRGGSSCPTRAAAGLAERWLPLRRSGGGRRRAASSRRILSWTTPSAPPPTARSGSGKWASYAVSERTCRRGLQPHAGSPSRAQ